MTYSVAPVPNFSGLDLVSAPDGSGCIDMLNIDVQRRDSIRCRDGFQTFYGTATDAPWNRLATFPRTGSNAQLVAGRRVAAGGGQLAAFDSGGSQLATQATTQSVFDFARVGTPTSERMYIADSPDTIRRWDGAAFSSPAGMPVAKCVAVQPNDNRLVAASITAGGVFAGGLSRIYFSDPGDPEAWEVDGSGNAINFVNLTPGDGEEIQGVVAWRELMFVFKPSRFFVFYGNNTDGTGGAVFNYRTIDAGVGLCVPGGAVAMEDGVYFLDESGVYRTTGGPPERISRPLDPFFRRESLPFFSAPALSGECLMASRSVWARLTAHEERLFVNLYAPGGGLSFRTFVYDTVTGQWMLWDLNAWPAVSMPQYDVSGVLARPVLVFGRYNDAKLYKVTATATDDNGTAITSRWRSGFYDLGMPDREKDIANTRLWGAGTVSVAGSRDFGDLDASVPVTLGAASAIGTAMHGRQKCGLLVSYEFSGTGPWALHSYSHELRGERPPGSRS